MNILRETRYLLGNIENTEGENCILSECSKLTRFAKDNYLLRSSTMTRERYCFYFGDKILMAKEGVPQAYIQQILGQKRLSDIDRILGCIAKLFPVISDRKEGKYIGDIIVAKVNGGYKVFDCEKNLSYEFGTGIGKKHTQNALDKFAGKLSIPYVRNDGGVIVEHYIHAIPCCYWDEELIVKNYCRALDDLAKYYQRIKFGLVNEIDMDRAKVNGHGDKRLNKLFNEVERVCLFKDSIPIVYCHGDFMPFNFLWDGNKQYYIDYEFSGEGSAFLDIFKYIFGWNDLGRICLLKDESVQTALKIIFQSLGLEWNVEMIKHYVYRYLLNYYATWVNRIDKGDFDNTVNEWTQLYLSVRNYTL